MSSVMTELINCQYSYFNLQVLFFFSIWFRWQHKDSYCTSHNKTVTKYCNCQHYFVNEVGRFALFFFLSECLPHRLHNSDRKKKKSRKTVRFPLFITYNNATSR